jgi:hypothetical protein
MANGRYGMDPYARFATTIKPQQGGMGTALSTYQAVRGSAADKKAQALKEAQFAQTKRASDQAMMINQERFNQQKRVIASGDILSGLENEEFSNLGSLPMGTGDVFDENAFMETQYGILGKKQEFMEKYRQRVDAKNQELGLNITPDLGKAESMYNQFTTREAEKKLVELMKVKQARNMSAKDFNLYLRGEGNTFAGSNSVQYYLQNVSPEFKASWSDQTGFVHGYETGWEDWIPGYGPNDPKSLSGTDPSRWGTAMASTMAVGGPLVGAELLGAGMQYRTKAKAMKGVTDLLKNKEIYQADGKTLKGGTNNWKTFLTDEQKKLLGDNLDDIKGKKGLNKWAQSQKSAWKNIRPSEWARWAGGTDLGASAKEKARVAWERTKGAKHKGLGPGAFSKAGAKTVLRGAGGLAPAFLPAAGQAVAGDEGQLAGRVGASALFGSQAYKSFKGRPLGFFNFAKKVLPKRLAKFGAKAAARQATAAAAGAVGGAGVGAIPTSIAMGLFNAGLSFLEIKSLFDDYKEYKKTGKIGP